MGWQMTVPALELWVKTKDDTDPDAEGRIAAIAVDDTELPSKEKGAKPPREYLVADSRKETGGRLVWVKGENVAEARVKGAATSARPVPKVNAAAAGSAGGITIGFVLVAVLQGSGVDLSPEAASAIGAAFPTVLGPLSAYFKTG